MKALETANAGDLAFRSRLLKITTIPVGGRRISIKEATVRELHEWIVNHRPGKEKEPLAPGPRRGPPIRRPEHLRIALRYILNDRTWGWLQKACELSGEVWRSERHVQKNGAASSDEKTDQPSEQLNPMGMGELAKIQTRIKKLDQMLDETTDRLMATRRPKRASRERSGASP